MRLDPNDLPDWAIKGRAVEPEWRKCRDAKRARRFVTVEWGALTAVMGTLGFSRAARLYLVLHLHRRLKVTRARNGWTELIQHELKAAGLADCNLGRDVTTLEQAGLVEVRRRLGKRPLLRLTQSGGDR